MRTRDQILSELKFLQQQEKLIHQRREDLLNTLSDDEDLLQESAPPKTKEDEIETEDDNEDVKFVDRNLSVFWDGGKLTFRKDGIKTYKFIKLIWDAGYEGIEMADMAEEIYGDPLADLKNILQRAREKLEEYNFPEIIKNNGNILRFSRGP